LETILKIENLTKLFPLRGTNLFSRKALFLHAVDGIDLEIQKGETFGIVGESGCGKTTLGRLILRLEKPTSGKIIYKNQDISSLNHIDMKQVRRNMQMIFQDPYSSLDPRKNILNTIAEPIRVHHLAKNNLEIKEKVLAGLRTVELPATEDFLAKLPGELSGGERQRVGIARVLVLGADFIIADEPVSMLDASVKAGIVSLLIDLKEKIGLTYIFITHEIGLAYYICDRIAAMYLGKIVEIGKAEDIVNRQVHPYTKLLMEATPPLHPDDKWGKKILDRGELSSCIEPPPGCRFHPRCSQVRDICRVEEPRLTEVGAFHYVACHQFSGSENDANNNKK
jgi:oligopeptide/dipeptide ABC transporter ATP-binding protein